MSEHCLAARMIRKGVSNYPLAEHQRDCDACQADLEIERLQQDGSTYRAEIARLTDERDRYKRLADAAASDSDEIEIAQSIVEAAIRFRVEVNREPGDVADVCDAQDELFAAVGEYITCRGTTKNTAQRLSERAGKGDSAPGGSESGETATTSRAGSEQGL